MTYFKYILHRIIGLKGIFTMDNLESIALTIFQGIFNNQSTITIEGESYRVNKTRRGLRNVTYEGIWFIEQNPQKESKYAQLAQQGYQIMWGIKGRTYILRVVDGKFDKLR